MVTTQLRVYRLSIHLTTRLTQLRVYSLSIHPTPFVGQAPNGWKKSRQLAPRMHLVDALTRMRLVASGMPDSSVPFKTNAGLMTLLEGEAALVARRHVALHITDQTISALMSRPDPEKPDLNLMQQLYNAGIGKCPVSGMPVFNPSACAPGLQKAIWRAYCGVAISVNTKQMGRTDEALDTLKEQLRAHTTGGD